VGGLHEKSIVKSTYSDVFRNGVRSFTALATDDSMSQSTSSWTPTPHLGGPLNDQSVGSMHSRKVSIQKKVCYSTDLTSIW
jgi:hypothetical protein